jgi:hypothetical protein
MGLALTTPFLAASAPASAVDVLLVLAVDVSGSVNQERFELQKRGYAAAFRSPEVVQAIVSGPAAAIGVAMLQWTGPDMQVLVADWALLHDAASAARFATALDAVPRQLFGGGTSISGALERAMALLGTAPFSAARQVIDVSGDGANNRGAPVRQAHDKAVAAGIVINGLPILTLEPQLDAYYRENVIGGPGAFVIAVAADDQFALAIRRKLISEIAWQGDRSQVRHAG